MPRHGAHAPDRTAARHGGGLVGRLRGDDRAASRPSIEHGGERHEFTTERVTIEPFDLRMRPRHALVIDRLAHWYYVPREWIKKVALMDGVYLMNNPFTFQAMEKHSAYCAMMRLGLKVPDTWLVPYKQPPADERFAYTAERYNRPFDLAAVAEQIGYPLFMKPFDGGAWVGVSQVRDAQRAGRALRRVRAAADAPAARGRRLRRVRPLALDRRRDDGHALRARPPAARPLPGRPRLPRRRDTGREVVTIGRTVNAFFRWEFNSCETLIKDGEVHPIDYANACPDVSLISLHYYFPWAIKALLRWSVYCCATGRPMRVAMDPDPWFAVARRRRRLRGEARAPTARSPTTTSRSTPTRSSATATSPTSTRRWRSTSTPPSSTRCWSRPSRARSRRASTSSFVAHYRGLLGAWVARPALAAARALDRARDLDARADAELGEDVAQVGLHRLLATGTARRRSGGSCGGRRRARRSRARAR